MKNGIVLAALLTAGQALAATPASVQSLAWLEGYWTGEKDGVAMEEVWSPVKGGQLLGYHRDVKDGKVVWWEFFRVAATPEGIVYFASPSSEPPTPFTLVESGPERAVFANEAHDFPKRILFWKDKGSLHARIEGPQGGKTVSEEWSWTKQ